MIEALDALKAEGYTEDFKGVLVNGYGVSADALTSDMMAKITTNNP